MHYIFKLKFEVKLNAMKAKHKICQVLFVSDEAKYNVGQLSRDRSHVKSSNILRNGKKSKHQLAILVPFRDRFDELLKFAPHMNKFLGKQNLDYHIFILNQVLYYY